MSSPGVPIQELKTEALLYAALTLALWPARLLRILHAESAAVVAFAAFFVAGLTALRRFEHEAPPGHAPFERVLAGREAALAVPWVLLTVTLLWTPNCGYAQGLLLFLLFPPVTVALAVAAAYALSGTSWRLKKTILCTTGVLVSLAGPVYDLGFHPQFYTYNHVFGGVLGPIYDEELALRPGLFFFRGLTLLWAFFLFLVGRQLRGGNAIGEDAMYRDAMYRVPTTGATLAAVALLIGLAYLFSARLGFNTPAWKIQAALGGHLRTAHFDLYYDPADLKAGQLARLAADHEYRYARLAQRLGAGVDPRIASYLYPDADTKAHLTGARRASVTPVWLARPQVHLLAEAYAQTFAHELAHVFSRPYGLPVLKASWSVGLVEGWAVALEPPSGGPTPHEQVAVAARLDGEAGLSSLAESVAARLSPLGFWTGRGAVSYTTMGSFVRYLLDRYGAPPLKQVYATADFEAVYGKPAHVLAGEWQRFLEGFSEIDAATEALVTRRFAVPSLFEKRCPHYVPPYRKAYRAGMEAWAAGDTAAAAQAWTRALEDRPGFAVARTALGRLRVSTCPAAALRSLDTLRQRTASAALVLGDAYALLGRPAAARAQYEAAREKLPLYANESIARVLLRETVADRPDVVRVLAAPDSAAAQAARLAQLALRTLALDLLRATRLLSAGADEQAARLLRSTPAPNDSTLTAYGHAVLERQRLVWLARSLYRSGRSGEAAAVALKAARAFAAAGALNEAAALDDEAAKMRGVSLALEK